MPSTKSDKSLYVICYDIPDDKRRNRLHKMLSGYGAWRQFSVFECYLTRKQHLELQRRIGKQIKPDTDHIRLYQICEACEQRIEAIGGPPPEDPLTYLI